MASEIHHPQLLLAFVVVFFSLIVLFAHYIIAMINGKKHVIDYISLSLWCHIEWYFSYFAAAVQVRIYIYCKYRRHLSLFTYITKHLVDVLCLCFLCAESNNSRMYLYSYIHKQRAKIGRRCTETHTHTQFPKNRVHFRIYTSPAAFKITERGKCERGNARMILVDSSAAAALVMHASVRSEWKAADAMVEQYARGSKMGEW